MSKDLPELPEDGVTPRTLMTKIGAWTLGHTLGRGAYAHVRLATHDSGYVSACKILPALHRPIARKVTRDERIDACEAHKELVLLKGLAGAGCPGTAGLEGVIPYQGWNFIFLTMYPSSAAAIPNFPNHRIAFFRRLLLSVQAIHDLDISHEDLKRSNVLATSELEPVLVDFGFAHFAPDGGLVRSLGGTMDYSSPEKLADKLYNPFANDIWSLGILLLKLLGLPSPYRTKEPETEDDFKRKVIDTEPNWTYLSSIDGPGRIGQVIRGMLRRDPRKRWTIHKILSHHSMQINLPDPPPFIAPSLDLPEDVAINEEILLDLAFLAFSIGQFFLCESIDVIAYWLLDPEPHWLKRWAGMLSKWQQREETLWEDMPTETAVNTPWAKAVRGGRLSGVDVAKISRASLRPLKEIVLSPKKLNIPTTKRPIPAAPATPRRRAPKRAAAPAAPKIPRKPLQPADLDEIQSPSTPIKQYPLVPAASALDDTLLPPVAPRKARKAEPAFKASSPKVIVRTRTRVRPMTDLTRLAIPPIPQNRPLMPVAAPEVDLIDLRDDPPPGPSSSTTLVATRPAVKTKQTAPAKTTSTTYEKTGTKPAKVLVPMDKENVPPAGERKGLKVPARKDLNPLQPTRRSPRWA